MGRSSRFFLASLLAALFAMAVPALAAADDDDDGGGGGGGTVVGGLNFAVKDNGAAGDLISGADDQLPAGPAAGTDRCGVPPERNPVFPVVGSITVRDNFFGSDIAVGAGTVPAIDGAPFFFTARSGPAGQSPAGVFAFGFPTERPSAGRITCLDVEGNIAYVGGERVSPGSGGGGGDDEDEDDDD